MAVDLVLRLLKMHVAGGADRLAQLLAEPHDRAVEFPELLVRAHAAVTDHEPVVAQRLDLQIVVIGGNALELRPILMVDDCAEQLARLARRADDQSFAVGVQLALGDRRHALKVLEV